MPCGTTLYSVKGLVAVIVKPNYTAKTIDSTGSIGRWIRIAIKRNGVTIEVSKPELNTGINQIRYQSTLKNGDQLFVQVSAGDRFYDGEFVEAFKWIPTPNLAFAPI